MEKESNYEENYGVVIFLDALGMKGVWKNENPNGILEKWDNFVETAKIYLKNLDKEQKRKVTLYAFSDTVIITVKDGPIDDLLTWAGSACSTLMEYEMTRKLYFRGCISIGKIYEHEKATMVLGPAVDEAAQYYSLPNLICLYAAPSAYSVLERLNESESKECSHTFAKYDIPFKDRIYKNGWIVKFNLCIPKIWNDKITKEFQSFKNLKQIAHYNLENLDNVEAGEKWRNTLEFMSSKCKFLNTDELIVKS